MASKFLFFHVLLALAVQLQAGRAPPEIHIHIISAVTSKNSPPIDIDLKAGGSLVGKAQLSPSQDYQIKVGANDVYFASAVFGLRFASFHAYEPARDKGRTVYWKADNDGFAISYDKIKWEEVAPWESG